MAHTWGQASFWKRLVILLIVLDVFVNHLTGGDPRETISSSTHKDRKDSWLAKQIIRLVEKIDPDHGETSLNPYVGEHTEDNRELNGRWRTGLIVFWLAALYAGWVTIPGIVVYGIGLL